MLRKNVNLFLLHPKFVIIDSFCTATPVVKQLSSSEKLSNFLKQVDILEAHFDKQLTKEESAVEAQVKREEGNGEVARRQQKSLKLELDAVNDSLSETDSDASLDEDIEEKVETKQPEESCKIIPPKSRSQSPSHDPTEVEVDEGTIGPEASENLISFEEPHESIDTGTSAAEETGNERANNEETVSKKRRIDDGDLEQKGMSL